MWVSEAHKVVNVKQSENIAAAKDGEEVIVLLGKKEKRVLFTEGPHKYKSGEELFAAGQSLFSRSILATGRADRKAS